MKAFETNGIAVTVDPLNGYPEAKPRALFDATGLIPYFVAEASEEETAKTALATMNQVYGFGLGDDYNMLDHGGKVDHDGRYKYPGDPELVPLVQFETTYVTVWVYEYGLVAVTDGQDTIMQRMD